jgi:hypothetical protein
MFENNELSVKYGKIRYWMFNISIHTPVVEKSHILL